MSMHSSRNRIVSLLIVAAAFSSALCEYKEGIDTTDTDGKSRQNLFNIAQNAIYTGSIGRIVKYGSPGYYNGYFNHAFDDIQKTPDTIKSSSQTLAMDCCYAIQISGNLFAKISFLQKLSDGRYTYRYGTNNVNQLVLPSTARAKPNNVFSEEAYTMPETNVQITWEPPLNTLPQPKGYIFYLSKMGASIDTSKPINPAQWDSIAYTTRTSLALKTPGSGYFNLVAVYNDGGKSDFLKGWTRLEMLIGVKQPVSSHSTPAYSHSVALKKASDGYRIEFDGLPGSILPKSIVFYSISGRQIARIDGIRGRQVQIPSAFMAGGMSLFKMFFRDNKVVSGFVKQ